MVDVLVCAILLSRCVFLAHRVIYVRHIEALGPSGRGGRNYLELRARKCPIVNGVFTRFGAHLPSQFACLSGFVIFVLIVIQLNVQVYRQSGGRQKNFLAPASAERCNGMFCTRGALEPVALPSFQGGPMTP
jgi:hypothetical protein